LGKTDACTITVAKGQLQVGEHAAGVWLGVETETVDAMP
jgi:hypothetical protein